jgi:hypothetical protein
VVAADELGGDVRGVGGAAAVAEEQNFAAFFQGARDELRGLGDLVRVFPDEPPLDLGAFLEGLSFGVILGEGRTPVKWPLRRVVRQRHRGRVHQDEGRTRCVL